MDTHEGCKQLWKNCIDCHAFFNSFAAGKGVSPARVQARGFKRRSHRSSYVERTENKAMEFNKAAALERSKSVKIVR